MIQFENLLLCENALEAVLESRIEDIGDDGKADYTTEKPKLDDGASGDSCITLSRLIQYPWEEGTHPGFAVKQRKVPR